MAAVRDGHGGLGEGCGGVVHAWTARLAVEQRSRWEDGPPGAHRAARLFGAAEALREALGAPVLWFQRQSYAQGVAALRAWLDDAACAAAWAEGRGMTLEQAIAYALEGLGS